MAIEIPEQESFDKESYIEEGIEAYQRSVVLDAAKQLHAEVYSTDASLDVFPSQLRGLMPLAALECNPGSNIGEAADLLSRIVGFIQAYFDEWHGLTCYEELENLPKTLEEEVGYAEAIVDLGNGNFLLRAISEDGDLLGSLVVNLQSGFNIVTKIYYYKVGNRYLKISQQSDGRRREVEFLEENPDIFQIDDLNVGPYVAVTVNEDGTQSGSIVWAYTETLNNPGSDGYIANNRIWFTSAGGCLVAHRDVVIMANTPPHPLICKQISIMQPIGAVGSGVPQAVMCTMASRQDDTLGPVSFIRFWDDIKINAPTSDIACQATYVADKIIYENTWKILENGYKSTLTGMQALPSFMPTQLEIQVCDGQVVLISDDEGLRVTHSNLENWRNHVICFTVKTGELVKIVLEAGIVKQIQYLPD